MAPGLGEHVDRAQVAHRVPGPLDRVHYRIDAGTRRPGRRSIQVIIKEYNRVWPDQPPDMLPVVADRLLGVSAVDEDEVHPAERWRELRQELFGVPAEQMHGHAKIHEPLQPRTDMLQRWRCFGSLAFQRLGICLVEEVKPVIRHSLGRVVAKRRLDHPAGMDGIPDADLEDGATAAQLDDPGEVAVAVGHGEKQAVQ